MKTNINYTKAQIEIIKNLHKNNPSKRKRKVIDIKTIYKNAGEYIEL